MSQIVFAKGSKLLIERLPLPEFMVRKEVVNNSVVAKPMSDGIRFHVDVHMTGGASEDVIVFWGAWPDHDTDPNHPLDPQKKALLNRLDVPMANGQTIVLSAGSQPSLNGDGSLTLTFHVLPPDPNDPNSKWQIVTPGGDPSLGLF